jgi:hypothetical protein
LDTSVIASEAKQSSQRNWIASAPCSPQRRAVPERRPPIEAQGQSLADLAAAIDARGNAPPVDRWNPRHCGHSGMRIARD